MNKNTFLFIIFLCIGISISAQTAQEGATSLQTKAQESLKKQEYTQARYLFKRAYTAFVTQGNYLEAIRCGVQANALYTRENLYKESFDFCREMDAALLNGELVQKKKLNTERFLLAKERLNVFSKLKNTERAKEQLARLEELGGAIKNDSVSEEVLYLKANYYFTFGPAEQGVSSYNKLIGKYKQSGNQEKINECYKNMIALAERVNNAPMAVRTYKAFVAWTDSIEAVNAGNELVATKQLYETTKTNLQEREDELSMQRYKIIALCTLSAILAGVLVFGALVLLRFIRLSRKQKKSIEIANEHNELKSQFIRNISAQMEPALNTLAQSAQQLSANGSDARQMIVQIDALRGFSNDIQELSHLEHTLTEPYKLSEMNANTFCESVMEKLKPFVKEGVEIAANAPKLQVKTNPEQLERILFHLLKNAAFYTETGKISLDFKKRGAHTVQFIVTDTGTGIPTELQANLFKPFTEIKDLTEGDGLGLPICSLIATKMNGSLVLDTSYTKGSRFVLELHS